MAPGSLALEATSMVGPLPEQGHDGEFPLWRVGFEDAVERKPAVGGQMEASSAHKERVAEGSPWRPRRVAGPR